MGVETDFISSIFDAIAATKIVSYVLIFRTVREEKNLQVARN